jgi:hypothetical protein
MITGILFFQAPPNYNLILKITTYFVLQLTDEDDQANCEEGCNIGGRIRVQQRAVMVWWPPLPYCDSS